MRSKSEIQVADRMLDRGMWYKPEAPVDCGSSGLVYPDFTILLPRSRKIVYMEHFGKMDDERYFNEFYWKMQTYPRHGIIPGKNLFMTFEKRDDQLSSVILENVLDAICSLDE